MANWYDDRPFPELYYPGETFPGDGKQGIDSAGNPHVGGHGHFPGEFFYEEYFVPPHYPGSEWWLDYGMPSPEELLRYYGSGKLWKEQQRQRDRKHRKAVKQESAQEIWQRHEKWNELLEAKAQRDKRARKDGQGFIEALLEQVKDELDLDLAFAKVATAKILAEMLGIARRMDIGEDKALIVAMQLVDMEINNG